MEQHIFSHLGDNLKVIIEDNSRLINWARGAGCLVLQDFFSSLYRGRIERSKRDLYDWAWCS